MFEEFVLVSPILDAIVQNTPGYSQAYAAGVPAGYSWCSGATRGSGAPPPAFTAVTGWGQVYPRAGTRSAPNAKTFVQVANAQTYVRRRATGAWELVQSQARGTIAGAHFAADFAGNRSVSLTILARPDGTADLAVPSIGYNSHFWLSARGTYAAGTVDGVYVQMDIRTRDPDTHLVANVGADWWRNATAEYAADFSNNPGAGMSNWVVLSTRWSRLYFYSVSAETFMALPPPPLAGSVLAGEQMPSRPLAPGSPCRAASPPL